jgi:hypothetical protein
MGNRTTALFNCFPNLANPLIVVASFKNITHQDQDINYEILFLCNSTWIFI